MFERCAGRQPLVGTPEEALPEQQPEPDDQGHQGDPYKGAHPPQSAPHPVLHTGPRPVPPGPVDYGDRVKIALMDSGIGLLAAAAAVRRLRPDAELVISNDPDGMPWGPRTPEGVAERALAVAGAAAALEPDALIIACNT